MPLRGAFLDCGFITRVHNRQLRALRGDIGEFVFGHFTTIARRLKRADDWRLMDAVYATALV